MLNGIKSCKKYKPCKNKIIYVCFIHCHKPDRNLLFMCWISAKLFFDSRTRLYFWLIFYNKIFRYATTRFTFLFCIIGIFLSLGKQYFVKTRNSYFIIESKYIRGIDLSVRSKAFQSIYYFILSEKEPLFAHKIRLIEI